MTLRMPNICGSWLYLADLRRTMIVRYCSFIALNMKSTLIYPRLIRDNGVIHADPTGDDSLLSDNAWRTSTATIATLEPIAREQIDTRLDVGSRR